MVWRQPGACALYHGFVGALEVARKARCIKQRRGVAIVLQARAHFLAVGRGLGEAQEQAFVVFPVVGHELGQPDRVKQRAREANVSPVKATTGHPAHSASLAVACEP